MINDLSSVTPPGTSRLRQAAVPAFFLLLGVVYASWAARIPAIRDALELNAAQLGLVLLGAEGEKSAGRSIMAMLHAWFCVGTLAGALFGSAMAALAVTPLAHFGAV